MNSDFDLSIIMMFLILFTSLFTGLATSFAMDYPLRESFYQRLLNWVHTGAIVVSFSMFFSIMGRLMYLVDDFWRLII